jgi:hypothetical protein
LKLNGTHQLLVQADNVNILSESVTPQKRSLLVASNEIGVAVNSEATKYTVMSHEENAGQNRNLKIGNKSLET